MQLLLWVIRPSKSPLKGDFSPRTKSPFKGDLEGLEDFKDHQYDLLAEHVRKYVDMDKLYEIMASPPALPRREGVGAR